MSTYLSQEIPEWIGRLVKVMGIGHAEYGTAKKV